MSRQKIRSVFCGSLLTLIALSLPALATESKTEAKTEGRQIAELTFSAIDANQNGFIHQGDLEVFRSDVFNSMDQDENARISYSEFSAWDPGFSALAAEANKGDAYTTALKIVFSVWDRNGDDTITEAEMRFAMGADFRRADVNDDSLLSEEEFLKNFTIIVAMRAAIRPDL